MVILGAVKVAERFSNEPVSSLAPVFIAADFDRPARSARPRILAGQRPSKNHAIAILGDAVARDVEVGKGGHEALRGHCDYGAPNRRRIVIDLERALLAKEGSNLAGVLAGPGLAIAYCKICKVAGHRLFLIHFFDQPLKSDTKSARASNGLEKLTLARIREVVWRPARSGLTLELALDRVEDLRILIFKGD